MILKKLALTDLHPAVVQAAAANVRIATAGKDALKKVVTEMIALPGDLLSPLAHHKGGFELIYGM